MEENKMDYQKELGELKESLDYFRAKEGNYKIVCIGEANLVHKVFKRGDGTDEPVEQLEFMIETGGKRYNWSVTKSNTKSGLYGQILKIASKNNNSLNGVVFDLFVKNNGKKNDYTIPQALAER